MEIFIKNTEFNLTNVKT